jgi:hypothetical protein
MDFVRGNPSYFGGALEMCEEFGLLPIMQFHCDYDMDMVCQFYFTVYFSTSEPRKLTWMTKNKVFEAEWSEFATLLGYPPSADLEDDGWRVHDLGTSMDKIVLAPLYDQAQNFVVGKIVHL